MSKFEVYLNYHGCIYFEIEAENEDNAKDEAFERAATMDPATFIRASGMEVDDCDVHKK